MLGSLGDRHGTSEEHGAEACSPARHKYSLVLFDLCFILPAATFNMLLKLSKHAGNDSRQTAAAVFQEMLHLDIG